MASTTAKLAKHVEKELHQNKVVIRRLPPDFTEEDFLKTVDPLPANSYYYFAPGDTTLGSYGCSRAYIAFDTESDILPFRDHFDGLVLDSENGTKYRITVEYAPFQAVPKKGKKKADSRIGTIEQDSDYKAFLEAYEATEEHASSLDLVSYIMNLDANKTKEVQPTPLTEYLDKKGGRRRGKVTEAKKKRSSSKGKGRESLREEKKANTRSGSRYDEDYPQNTKKDKASPSPKDKNTKDQCPEWSVIEASPSEESKLATDRGKNKHRVDSGDRRSNKDRPDKSIYSPQNREESRRGKSREDDYQGKSQRYKGKDNAEYKHKEERSSGRPRGRGRGPRDRGRERTDFRSES